MELGEHTFAAVGAPVGLGLRFTVRDGPPRAWDVCLSTDVGELLLNNPEPWGRKPRERFGL